MHSMHVQYMYSPHNTVTGACVYVMQDNYAAVKVWQALREYAYSRLISGFHSVKYMYIASTEKLLYDCYTKFE